MKICVRCKASLSTESFCNHKRSADGLRDRCRECNSEVAKLRYIKNKAYIKERSTEWKQNNPAAVLAQKAKRRASKLNATPPWITAEHLHQIEDMYWLAKDLEAISGEAYHVDHIIPLQGKNVCGLHLPWNLQVLPSDINLAKNNSHTF